MKSFFVAFVFSVSAVAGDWPMWRHDAGRTATTSQKIPADLKLKWVHHLPKLTSAWKDERLNFDKGYEPIVLGQRMFVSSSWDDGVTAFDTETGKQLWKFFADGPVRFAPVGGQGRVMFGSDDGYFYCVKASDGSLVWKRKAVPSERKVVGNDRVISVWPVRGGPVLKDDRVYFAAGVWPLEGVFVYCLDVKNGDVVWLNDRCSFRYGIAPHNAEAFGGLAPQGYLVIDGDDLIVPSSSAYPARFDLATGKLKEFDLPGPGRLVGGWFASTPSDLEAQKLKRRGLLHDSAINTKRHEDKPRAKGLPEIRTTIRAGGDEVKFAEAGLPGVEGEIHTMLAADGKLFAVTDAGSIFCFAAEGDGVELTSREAVDRVAESEAMEILRAAETRRGFGVVLGLDDVNADFCQSLVSESEMNWIVVGADAAAIDELRRALRQIPAARLMFQVSDPADVVLPKWFADVVVVSDSQHAEHAFDFVRPFGGKLICDGEVLETRSGAIPGTSNYTGGWTESADELVRSPVGLQWYGDAVQHFKRSPQPLFVDGVMISQSKDWLDATTRVPGKVDYRLQEPMFTDVYTGRQLAAAEVPDELRQSFSNPDRETIQPNQYRPPRQKDAWKPGQPKNGRRQNPLTGEEEDRVFPKSYGCDGGFDYGLIYSMRSGTAAFYDKRNESGTINIAGPRSGCTNSIVPANGLLNLPYFFEGCTCSYPLPSGLALISMPESFEQWTSWGAMPAEKLAGKIQRVGVNFGAPGDRKTRAGTLWLDHPNIGGPSPEIDISTVPEKPETFYRHSLWLAENEEVMPWVAASGARDVRQVKIGGLKNGDYTVRLIFCGEEGKARTVPEISIQGEVVGKAFEIEAGLRGVVREFGVEVAEGEVVVEFAEGVDLSGVEVR